MTECGGFYSHLQCLSWTSPKGKASVSHWPKEVMEATGTETWRGCCPGLLEAVCSCNVEGQLSLEATGNATWRCWNGEVKLVRVTKRVHGAYFSQLYLTKMSQEGDETEYIAFDLRPSDAINIAVRCKVPIQVNKHLAYSDGMRVIETGKLSMKPPASDILPHTELDQPSGQRCLDSEEFKIVSDLNEVISEERYKDAGTLPPADHLCFIYHSTVKTSSLHLQFLTFLVSLPEIILLADLREKLDMFRAARNLRRDA
ncbi:Bifunctional nuclease 2 [Hibiscus syriacus]|uniref:Bifunctional nuclease 2 n=1 Tax=Hibiscus syriacus TaxID=106335 RepID=A0A6A3BFX9_HIBSY|nr:Bifunctional nuclease 2 [Hibiscus syriacus]